MVEGFCADGGSVASEPQAEHALASVGLPEPHRYRGKGIPAFRLVPAERAQARNLGGTAKQQPFALKPGVGRLFFQASPYSQGERTQ